jgi:putative tricarboxylic transport membrane protein
VFRRTVLRSGLLALPALAGCAAMQSHNEGDLRIMVPNAPGSGYDITARTVATVLDISGIRRGVEVFNLPGGQGTVGLRRLVYERGNSSLMMLMGLGLVGAQLTSPPAEITPIARLIEEPEVVVVTPDSPLLTLDDLVKAWTADPSSIVVGGGSSPGGPDHLAPMLMAKAIGIPPVHVRYSRHDGGGALLAAILARQVTFAVSSLGEYAGQIRAGQLRVLAVTSGTRARGVPAPTLCEAGVDVVFANWRGLVAPPGLTAKSRAAEGRAAEVRAAEVRAAEGRAAEVRAAVGRVAEVRVAEVHAAEKRVEAPGVDGAEALRQLVASLERSATWREAIDAHGWTGAYIAGAEFGTFLEHERQRVGQVLNELGILP